MSYTPPASDAVNASWQGAAAYTPPSTSTANATWASETVSGRIAVPTPLGMPALLGVATDAVDGLIAVPGPLGAPALVGGHSVVGRASVPSPLGIPATRGLVVTVCRAAVPSPLGMPRIVGRVVRYELRGEVRDQGVLVNRTVRVYRRDTGALTAEGDTVSGAFAIHAGFAAGEYYLVPINLDPAATDFAPPCANRVTSVLAMD